MPQGLGKCSDLALIDAQLLSCRLGLVGMELVEVEIAKVTLWKGWFEFEREIECGRG